MSTDYKKLEDGCSEKAPEKNPAKPAQSQCISSDAFFTVIFLVLLVWVTYEHVTSLGELTRAIADGNEIMERIANADTASLAYKLLQQQSP